MALLFMDSFDHYATADVTTKWNSTNGTNNPTIVASNGRRSTACLTCTFTAATTGWLALTPTTPAPSGATAICGFAFKPTTFSGGYMSIMGVRRAGTTQFRMGTNATGTLSVYRGADATLLGTSVNAMSTGSYYFIELKVLLSTTVGTVDIMVNGSSWLSLTGQNTQGGAAATWDEFHLGNITGSTGSSGHKYDDLYLCDGSGSAPSNTFLGDCTVECVFPSTGNGSNTGLTTSTGSDHGSLVDETAPNGDTDYNESSTLNTLDTYNYPNMAAVTSATVFGVQPLLYTKKTDATARSIAPVIRHASTDYVGTNIALGTSYLYGRQIYEQNPGTSAAWTVTDINAAEVGMKVTV